MMVWKQGVGALLPCQISPSFAWHVPQQRNTVFWHVEASSVEPLKVLLSGLHSINSSRDLQDAPSISSEEDVTKMKVFLKEKMAQFYEAEHSPQRKTSVICLPDSRVDVCFYILEPHQLPQEDIDAIIAIGEFTSVVPLLGKVRQRACAPRTESYCFLSNSH